MRLARFRLLILLLAFCALSAGQEFASSTGIDSAILEGQKAKGRFQGLELQDSGVSFGQALAGAMAGAHLPSGYRIVIYTPLEWIKQQSSNAAREYRKFSKSDLTPSMVANVVRVRVYPSLPTYVSSSGTMLASSVDHVVIRDAQRNRVVQPIRTELFSESAQNAMGATASYNGVDALFDIKEISAIRDANDEFFITIVGRLGERNVKVKRRALSKLSFAQINSKELQLSADPVSPFQRNNDTAQQLIKDAMARASAMQAAAFSEIKKGNDVRELTMTAEAALQALRKVDAGLKISAPPDVLTSALMDAQVRLDELQHRPDKNLISRTVESLAFTLQGFLDFRGKSSPEVLRSAREALESAALTLDGFKSSGSEPERPAQAVKKQD